MSTEQQANGKIAEKNEKVAEVTEKLGNLAVDNNNKANEAEPARQARGGRPTRGRAGRGRGGRAGRTFQPRPPYEDQVKQIEEELKTKKVLETGVKGYVKWFSVRGRYGFVARGKAPEESEKDASEKKTDEKPEDYFVHQTAIVKSSTIKYYLRTLEDDEPVVFDIVEGRKGPEAANVTGPNGENVRGSRFSRTLLSRWSAAGRRGPKGERKARTDAPEDGEKAQEESAEGEVHASKRRPRRARGKLQPTAENGADGAAAEKQDKEKGDGDAATAAAAGEKKGRRRNNKKGKKDNQGEQPAAEPAAAQA